jgi:hypothetical protein
MGTEDIKREKSPLEKWLQDRKKPGGFAKFFAGIKDKKFTGSAIFGYKEKSWGVGAYTKLEDDNLEVGVNGTIEF